MPINSKPNIHSLVMCANIFVRKNGKYLMIRRSSQKKHAPGVVHPIGGKIDADENPYLAAQREILEEAGIKVKNLRLEAVILEIHHPANTDYNWLIFHYSADFASGRLKTTPEGELISFTKKELTRQLLYPSVRHTLRHILNPKDGTVFATFRYNKNRLIISKKIEICTI